MRVTLAVKKGPHRGRVFAFHEHDNFIVGRAKCAHFRLPVKDVYFSRVHFMIEVNPPRCRLMDLGSTNGTRLNGRLVTLADLKDGDRITGGKTVIGVSIEGIDPAGPSDPPTISPPDPATIRAASSPPAREAEGQPPPRPGMSEPSSSVLRISARSGPSGCRACGRPGPAGPDPAASLCRECREQVRQHHQPIAGYQILRELGRGGMGVVYLALREATNVLVALKTIIPQVKPAQGDLDRFVREANILRDLDHPNIVAFRDIGESGGHFFFAMDYVPGVDAARLLREHGGPLPIGRAVGLACQLLEALQYAHDRRLVHRDIKPSNLLVAEVEDRDVVRLADFGLARIYQASRISGLTVTGDVGGTPAFMAPEQITHYREAMPATDLYAAGATLYNLLTERYVYDFPKGLELKFLMILLDDPVPVRSRRREIPEGLAAVIHRALAREPRDRFPDARTMREALLMSS
jgi:hypothetical protein